VELGFGNCEALSFELLSKPAYPLAAFLLLVSSHVEQEIIFVDRESGELKVRVCSPPRSSPENNSTVYVPAAALVDRTRPRICTPLVGYVAPASLQSPPVVVLACK